jgi:hypothetical protein
VSTEARTLAAIRAMTAELLTWLPAADSEAAARNIAMGLDGLDNATEDDVHLAVVDALRDAMGHRDWEVRVLAMARVRDAWLKHAGALAVNGPEARA